MNYITFPNCTPSPMEDYIIKKLKRFKVAFVREISFNGLINPKTKQSLRYDFYVPEFNLIIEYDGKAYHNAKDVKERDAIKDRFAADNGITMYRICGGSNKVDLFFKSQYWLSQTKKSIIHKDKTNRKKKKPKPIFIEVEQPVIIPKTQSEMKAKIEQHRLYKLSKTIPI